MRRVRVSSSVLPAVALLAFSGSGFARVSTSASTSIEAPAPPIFEVIQNILSQANIVVTVLATPTATVVPSPASIATGPDETLQFTTSATDLTPTSGLIMSQEAVSVNVAPIATAYANADESRSNGVIVVLAQYN